jgi:ABC-type nitrate/sulfonate/bicarbonate transport system ATPase subunit
VTRLAAEERTTVVFITHDLEEAIYLGDQVIVLAANPGRIAEKIAVEIPRPRSQLETREDRRFLAYRHRLFGLLQR